jgi:uncharacterized protein
MNHLERILLRSPWWSDPDWEQDDRSLRRVRSAGFSFRHLSAGPVGPQDLPPGQISIVRGPRQVGKTTELKLLARDLIASGIPPRSIAYCPCDDILHFRELMELIRAFVNTLRVQDRSGYLFLDEITAVKDWAKAVKSLADGGELERVYLLLTGSSAVEIKRGYERMPGRRAGGFDRAFLPMGFGDFCRAFGPPPFQGSLMEVIADESVFTLFEVEATTQKARYLHLLDAYLSWGGFPMVVTELIQGRPVEAEVLGVYRSVLFSEFEKQRRSVPLLMGLMRKLHSVLGVPVSYNALTQDTGCRSNAVVQDYLSIFSAAFLGFEVPCIDLVHRRPFPKREKKFYAVDPILWKIIGEHAGLPAAQEAALADRWAGLGSLEGLYYFRSRKGNEVDFVLLNTPADPPFGVEVKYQARVSGWDEQSIAKEIGRGVLVTRDAFKWGGVCHIPLWAFLLLNVGGDSRRGARS